MKILVQYIGWCSFLFLMACSTSSGEEQGATSSPTTSSVDAKDVKEQEKETLKTIVFFGNSLSAGYGVSPEESFVGLIEKRIDSLNLPYKVINAGLSGETTAGGASRIDWILKQKVDIFILELGGNDALRGIEPASSYENLQTIVDKTKSKYPQVTIIIAGMMAPPNMGNDFTKTFRDIFPKIAKQNDALLIPFLLDKVGGIPSLNLVDGIHPNPEGHKIVTENVWTILEKAL